MGLSKRDRKYLEVQRIHAEQLRERLHSRFWIVSNLNYRTFSALKRSKRGSYSLRLVFDQWGRMIERRMVYPITGGIV
jgi:hypothetical protein